jgi:hypothetical protein
MSSHGVIACPTQHCAAYVWPHGVKVSCPVKHHTVCVSFSLAELFAVSGAQATSASNKTSVMKERDMQKPD